MNCFFEVGVRSENDKLTLDTNYSFASAHALWYNVVSVGFRFHFQGVIAPNCI